MKTRSSREHTSMAGRERRNPSAIEGGTRRRTMNYFAFGPLFPERAHQFRDRGDTHERRQVEMSFRGEMRPESVGAFRPDRRRTFAYSHGHDVPVWLVSSDSGLVAGIRDRGQGPVEARAKGPLSAGPLAQGRRGPGPVTPSTSSAISRSAAKPIISRRKSTSGAFSMSA